MRYKNYIFDCDGVILDSNQFKLKAMAIALNEYPADLVEDFIQHFKKNFGKSRFYHIEIFSNNYSERRLNEIEKQRTLQIYAQQCEAQYLECELCSDVLKFVETLPASNCWVVSGSEQTELRKVFHERNLTKYFNEIYGSPTLKNTNVGSLLQLHNLDADDTCLFGDSMGDYEAAIENNIHFIFCKKYSNTPELDSYFRNLGIPVINTFTELL